MDNRKTIVIAHKHPGLMSTIAECLEVAGYNVKSMSVGESTRISDVAAFARDSVADLVLIVESFAGRGGEGLDAAAQIKQDSQSLPVALISGEPAYLHRARELGLAGYVPLATEAVNRQYADLLREFVEKAIQSQS